MKKYLFIALAALGFAACAENNDGPNAPIHNGELEESYIAINLMAADNDTRAAEDTYGYEDGTTAERAVKTAYFFFFDANGNPFNVTTSAPGGEKNHLSLTISEDTTSGMPNVSDIKNAVLLLNTYKGVYPSKIVAVINWTPVEKTYSLTQLHSELATLGNDTNGYVMSNSIYMDGAGKMVDAVALTAANIKTTADAAKDAPIDIYVERIAAKVVVTGNNVYDTQKDSTPILTTGQTSKFDVYVKLLGWELFNDYSNSTLLKNIDTTWEVTTLGLTWNDIPYYRCYWADSQNTDPEDNFSWSYADPTAKGFQTAYGFGIAAAEDEYATRSTYTYCGENTNQVVMNGKKIESDFRTKVILKGQLMKADSEAEGGYSTLELARWYGTEYAGNEALRIAVANSLKYTLYYKDGENYVSIKPEDLQCVAGQLVGAEAYEVGFQLSTAGLQKTWYKYDSTNGYVASDNLDDANKTATNTYLKSVEPALLYTEGQTYYTVDIKHLGATGKTAEYGVVRNHVYQIDIESIKGYGSPVFSGDIGFLKPEFPTEDEASYVAARINVLSWKVVKQGVDIVQ